MDECTCGDDRRKHTLTMAGRGKCTGCKCQRFEARPTAPVVRGACELCGEDGPSCGPWRDGTRRWASVCGQCKIRMAQAQPGVLARATMNFA